jgi:hypothetical protein
MKAVYNDQLVTSGTVPWVHKIVSCRRPGLKGFQQEVVTVQPYRAANVTPRAPSGVRVQIRFAAGGQRQDTLCVVDLSELREWW